jgi:anaerobic selenocysteine-containing dehydrogenase
LELIQSTDNPSNGCGMDIGVKDGKIVGVRGRASDRVNKGRLGPKGMHS